MAFLFAVPVSGQKHFVGLKGGLNLTKVFGKNFEAEIFSKNGLVTGLTYQYDFNDNFHLGMDFIFSQKGFKSDIIFINEDGNAIGNGEPSSFIYNYIAFPVKGGFSFGNKLRGFVNIGIFPAFLIKAKTEIPTGENGEPITLDYDDFATKNDFGGLMETGVTYKITNRFLLYVSLEYQQSLISITNDKYLPGAELKSYGVSASLGVKYSITKN